jgi:hypothetical protein
MRRLSQSFFMSTASILTPLWAASFLPSRLVAPSLSALLFVMLLSGHLLNAETHGAHRTNRHSQSASHSFALPNVPDPPLLASISHLELVPLSEPRRNASFSSAGMPPAASVHQSVNLNLLLPPTMENLASATATTKPTRASARDLILPSAFAEPSALSTDEAARFASRLNDPQFYARHIRGVGPIVDRLLKESKAHPHITRVLESLQPQF